MRAVKLLPWRQLRLRFSTGRRPGAAPGGALMVAVNLLPWRQQRLKREWRQWCALLLALPMLGVVLGAWGAAQRQLNHQQAALLAAHTAAQRLAAGLQARTLAGQQALDALRHQRQQQQQRLRQLRQWQDFSAQIAAAIPAETWLTELKTGAQGVQLRGLSRSVGGVHQFREGLSQRQNMQRVASGSVTRHQEAVQFSLQVMLRQSEPAAHGGQPDD